MPTRQHLRTTRLVSRTDQPPHTALELDPNDPDGHNNLDVELRGKGDLAAAISSIQTALELHPNDQIEFNN